MARFHAPHNPTNPIALDAKAECDEVVHLLHTHHQIETLDPCFVMKLNIDHTHISPAFPHVTNLEYVRWLEVLATMHAEALGYVEEWYIAQNLIWFIGRHDISYRAELVVGNSIRLVTWVESVSRFRATRRYAFLRSQDNALVATAATDWVLVTRDTRKPVRVSPEMTAAFLGLRAETGQKGG